MPSEKHRITGKSQVHRDVEKVTIKTEPVDILPLSGYVDDRVELLKQAFHCLKPKSIKSIAPEFLQNKSIEKIQEACLNEVLGMSKKRLLSIINATKCPTDTESSSDEEDVQRIEAHISLDEISSEDEVSKGKKKKHKKHEKKEVKNEEKPPEKEEQTEPKKTKEYTVLELLELQARARAIRSQLALEPVTKIEIAESDDETVEEPPVVKPPQPPPKSPSSSGNHASRSQTREKPSTPKKVTKSKDTNRNGTDRGSTTDESPTPRRIKLKRDWRKKNQESIRDRISGPEKIIIEVRNNLQQKNPSPEKESSEERDCGSPDVLPIIPSPETFCISDSDEEITQDDKSAENTNAQEPEKEKIVAEELEKQPEADNENQEEDQPEEGEVLDELELSIEDEETLVKEIAGQLQPENDKPEEKENCENAEKPQQDEPVTEAKSEDELNDDCIEIECNDILEEHQENAEQKEESDSRQKTDVDDEVLKIDDSSDEDNLPLSQLIITTKTVPDGKHSKIESWNSRWLESLRVSKIMATSRLGNSVRRKIKTKSKKTPQEVEESEMNTPEETEHQKQQTQEAEMESNVEVGSVDHFHELAGKSKQ
ncbi:uncharacterized protein DMENIID0001_023730 [Sergentomyia squamirostris]